MRPGQSWFITLAIITPIASSAVAGDLDPPAAPAPTMVTLTDITVGVASAETAAGSAAANAASANAAAGAATVNAAAAEAAANTAAANASAAALAAQAAETAAVEAQDPRTPITTVPITISSEGSHFLTGNMIIVDPAATAVTVTAEDVTIDLNGFSLTGPGTGSGRGIDGEGAASVTVLNGTVRGFGGRGISLGDGAQVRDVRVASNGAGGFATGLWMEESSVARSVIATGNSGFGLRTGAGGTVVNCVAEGNGNDGIVARDGSVVRGCTARGNQDDGFEVNAASVVECSAVNNASGAGIRANAGSVVLGCTCTGNSIGVSHLGNGVIRDTLAATNTIDGISVTGSGTVSVMGCTAASNGRHGITIGSRCLVTQNICSGNGTDAGSTGAGISTGTSGNRVEGNTVSANEVGIDAPGSGSLFVRNSAGGNSTANYQFGGGDTDALAVAPGSGFTALDEWTNILF